MQVASCTGWVAACALASWLGGARGYDGSPAWSPDRRKIAFVSVRDGYLDVYVMNADGSGQRKLTRNQASDNSPVWSPDGKRIAFVSDRDGSPDIYVMNADGRNQRNLTQNRASDTEPVWSPDGRRIAFVTNRRDKLYNCRECDPNREIYAMNADGGSQQRLTSDGDRIRSVRIAGREPGRLHEHLRRPHLRDGRRRQRPAGRR